MKFFFAIAAGVGTALLASTPAVSGTVNVPTPSPYSYNDSSVRQLKIRGSYGSYITFYGRTVNSWEGTEGSYIEGSPGSLECTSYGLTTSCDRVGYIAPKYISGSSGGVENRSYRYELDCRDMTFDRKGDKAKGVRKKGWMPVSEDPTANAVAEKYCPIISSLPTGIEFNDD